MKNLLACALLLLLYSCSGQNVNDGKRLINKETLLQHVKILSSDEFGGRAPATEGARKAVDYISSQFTKIGLAPINGSHTQKLDLIRYQKVVDKSWLKIKEDGKLFSFRTDGEKDENLTFYSTSLNPVDDITDAEIIFVGYAVEAPEHDWDDFKGVDVKGKILLFLNNDPQIMKDGMYDPEYFKGESRTYYGRHTYKFEQAMKHGAAGGLLIHTTYSAGYPFQVLSTGGLSPHFTLDLPGAGAKIPFLAHVDSLTSDRIARTFGKTLPELFELAKRKDFKPINTGLKLSAHIETDISKKETVNIFGVAEGTDPKLKDEYIVFSAHYDHLGTRDGEGDQIFNGAWDNASGTASIMNLAEAFAKSPTKRSLIFLACAAEESGSLGSMAFTANCPLPLKQIVGNINIDMPNVHGLTRDIAVVGINSNSIGDAFKTIAKNILVEGKPFLPTDDPEPNAGLFYRSDQVNFAKKGIPAVFVFSGKDFIGKPDNYKAERRLEVYHKVADEINSDWDLTGLERDLKFVFDVGQIVGNDAASPKWHVGNEFETQFNALYGK